MSHLNEVAKKDDVVLTAEQVHLADHGDAEGV